jgi:hypothetical protein
LPPSTAKEISMTDEYLDTPPEDEEDEDGEYEDEEDEDDEDGEYEDEEDEDEEATDEM